MKLRSALTINGRRYSAGSNVSWWSIYPFFAFHMLMFGGSGFFMAYSGAPISFLYAHGGLAIFIYCLFYLTIFGVDEVKWMFINALLGLYGITAEIDFLLSLFGKHVRDFPIEVHVIPFLYYILYTFLLRQAVLDIFGARSDAVKLQRVNRLYVIGSLLVYTFFLFT